MSFLVVQAVLFSIGLGLLPGSVHGQERILMLVEAAGMPFEEEGGGGIGDALRNAGFVVDVIDTFDTNATDPQTGAVIGALANTVPFTEEQIAFLESYDLLYATRSLNSGNYAASPEEIAQWNMLEVPMLMGSVHLTRQNRWQWFNSDTLMDFEAAGANATGFTVEDPDHPVFAGGLTGEMFDEVLNVQANDNQGFDNNGVFLGTHVNNANGVVMAIWEEPGLFHPAADPGVGEHLAPRAYFYQMRYHETDEGAGVPANYTRNGLDLIVSLATFLIGSDFVPPPTIDDLIPANRTVFYDASGGLSFTTSSDEEIPVENISVVVNGSDVSGDLVITGTANERQVSYDGLQPSTVYIVEISVENVNGLREATATFDTFSEDTEFVIEAEDFNFDGGQFFDEIVLCNDFEGVVDGCYFDRISVPNVDALDNGGSGDDNVTAEQEAIAIYRFSGDTLREEEVDTIISNDVIRSKFADAPAGANGDIQDYDIELIDAGDWWNYTRTFEDSFYRVFLRVTANTDVVFELALVTSDRTQENQTLDPIGSFEVTGGGGYKTVPLTTAGGGAAVVSLDGVQTLRLMAMNGGAGQRINYLMLAPVEGTPTIVDLTSPMDGAVFAENADITIAADATGPDGTAASITQVEFFASLNGESMSLGVDTEAPFEITTNALGLGNWELTAAATADDETGAVSVPVSIVVDSTPPSILGVQNGVDLDEIVIAFDEALDQATAENTDNYSIDPSVSISGAQLLPNQKTVVLTTGALTVGADYTVTVTGVEDPYGNAIAETSTGLTAEEAVSIAINFAAGRPDEADPDNSSFVDGPAGVLMTANWNNTEGANGDASNLLVDVDGEANETFASVNWSAAGTWASTGAGEENNDAPEGEDRDLMTGYVDNTPDTPIVITASSIPFSVYDVYVYIKGGVTGRGGEYTIDGQTQEHTVTTAFTGDYVLGSEGDYLIFQGVAGSSFTLTADATNTRAPVNGIEIVSTQRAALEQLDPLQFGAATIAINFAADEPGGNRSDVEGAAGARRVANWNNVDLLSGEQADLVADAGGAPVATSASVVWSANNTWRTTDAAGVNTAPEGEDRDLMTGYLDNTPENPISIDVSDIPFATYDVYVYILGDNVTGGRGGDYTIGDTTIEHVMTTPFDGTYAEGVDGNYEVFRGVTGSSFTLTATATMGSPMRAPVVAIEIVNAVPTSLAINFAADEPEGTGSAVDGPAGVLETGIWNNVDNVETLMGTASELVVDVGGSAVETEASVTWSAAGTWSSDQFTPEAPAEGEDRDLLTGYLDTNNDDPITITVGNVPFNAYDVYVYILSDNSTSGRGGPYTIGNTTIIHRMSAQFGGEFVESMPTMEEPTISEGGHYIIFRGMSGSEFTLTADPTLPEGATQRAPVNAIEIVPAGGAAAGMGGVVLTIGLNGDGTVTIGWMGDGTLQMTPSLSPPDWQDVAGQTNPYMTDATMGDAFFRVVQ